MLAYQGAVRAMISHTIVAAGGARTRPGVRFSLIDYALEPFEDGPAALRPDAMTRLKQELAIVVSAESLFTLTDLCGLSADDAIASAVRAASALTRAAFAGAAFAGAAFTGAAFAGAAFTQVSR